MAAKKRSVSKKAPAKKATKRTTKKAAANKPARKTAAKKGPAKKAPAKRPARKTAAKKGPAKKKTAAKKAPAKKKAAAKKNPQCGAKTASGTRCKRPSTDRSKYCNAHKGYRPTKGGAKKAPAKKAPAKKKTAAKKKAAAKKNPQCGAKTASGTRCKRPSTDRSKYCNAHKGYRPKRS